MAEEKIPTIEELERSQRFVNNGLEYITLLLVEKAKSSVRKSIETLRDELQKLFPKQKVVVR